MDNNIENARPVSMGEWGATFQGVGDKDCESHFTFVKSEGFHVSTYLNQNLLGGYGSGNEKIKFDSTNY